MNNPLKKRSLIFYREVLRESIAMYFGKDMPVHAAALAFYTIFSLPSMLFIVMWTAARFYREVAVREAIFTEISALGMVVVKWAGELATFIIEFDSMLVDVGATTTLFALFFRYLPDANLKWKDTWFGAFVTAGLFTGGKYLIGFIIGNSRVADLYEAAGSVLVLMLWVYYASAIFLFGATFTFTRAQLMRSGRNELP